MKKIYLRPFFFLFCFLEMNIKCDGTDKTNLATRCHFDRLLIFIKHNHRYISLLKSFFNLGYKVHSESLKIWFNSYKPGADIVPPKMMTQSATSDLRLF